MSIYATHGVLKVPRYGDFHTGSEWVEVVGQGVPAHIGTPSPGHGYEGGDPYASFLPPAVPVSEEEEDWWQALRAMVIIRDGTEKVGQEYVRPLIVLSGQEYATIPFSDLQERICDALRADRPRLVAEFLRGDGSSQLIFERGSVREVPPSDDRAQDA